jgi:hypothetical protein
MSAPLFRTLTNSSKELDDASEAALSSERLPSYGLPPCDANYLHAKENMPAEAGSNVDMDILDEDLHRSHESRATGFLGQNSEVQWLRSLKTQEQNVSLEGEPYRLPYELPDSSNKASAQRTNALHARRNSSEPARALHVSDSTFYLDGDDLDVDIMVDPYELPPPETAEKLFDCYMETVHSSFPVVPDLFENQFRKYSDSMKRNRPFQVPEHWQATLNLVFAIGAQYSHLIQAEWGGDERDHLIYMTRAIRILGLDKIATSLHAPSLSIVQVCCRVPWDVCRHILTAISLPVCCLCIT